MLRKEKSRPADNASASASSFDTLTGARTNTVSYATGQQWAYQRGAQSAATTTKQIEDDMLEVRNIIANYAVEPLEILHLGKLTIVAKITEYILL